MKSAYHAVVQFVVGTDSGKYYVVAHCLVGADDKQHHIVVHLLISHDERQYYEMVDFSSFIMQRPTVEHFRAWRKSVGFTQEEAADVLGVAIQTVRQWEQGKSPVPHWAGRFAALYDVVVSNTNTPSGWAQARIEERQARERQLIEDAGWAKNLR